MYACLYRPPALDDSHRDHGDHREERLKNISVGSVGSVCDVVDIAREFSPRYERHRDDLVSIDISGLERLFQRRSAPAARARRPPSVWKTIGEELRRTAAARGVRAQVAIAATRTAAIVVAHARPGLTIIDAGGEAEALAPISIGILKRMHDVETQSPQRSQRSHDQKDSAFSAVSAFERWGVRTLGDLAVLPSADLAARLGGAGLACQAIARGEDVRPLVPTPREERFESSLDL